MSASTEEELVPRRYLVENLRLLDEHTAELVSGIAALSQDDLTEPTLCAGWTRAHVLTHLARNAEALTNLVGWARTGVRREAYISEDARGLAIQEGSQRTVGEIVKDVAATAESFRGASEALREDAGDAEVQTRIGSTLRGSQIPALRLAEVIFHHVDLKLGFSFRDAPENWVRRMVARGARQWDSQRCAPSLTLASGDEQWHINDGGPVVRGAAPDLLLWIARGVENGLEHSVELPTPPPWA